MLFRSNKYTPNYVIFDLETTGISPNYDEVIEISALKVKGGEVVDEFNTLVNPGRKIPFGATKKAWLEAYYQNNDCEVILT